MLRWRLLLGAVLISALVGAFWLDGELETPGMVLFPIALVLALAAADEYLSLLAASRIRPLAATVYGGTPLAPTTSSVPP
jgi:hypothetical protein